MNQLREAVNRQNQRIPWVRLCNQQPLKQQAEIAIRDKTATFSDLVMIEPGLQGLMDEAREYKKQSRGKRVVCANAKWYGATGIGLKDRLVRLVGWDSRNILLRNNYCYDLAYHAVYDALPYCKNCNCL